MGTEHTRSPFSQHDLPTEGYDDSICTKIRYAVESALLFARDIVYPDRATEPLGDSPIKNIMQWSMVKNTADMIKGKVREIGTVLDALGGCDPDKKY